MRQYLKSISYNKIIYKFYQIEKDRKYFITLMLTYLIYEMLDNTKE